MSLAKFYFENEIGRRVDLGALSDLVFTNVTGLGLALKPSYANLGEGFFNVVNTKDEPQKTINGDIVVLPSSYERYREFVNWVSAAQELKFVYCPYGSEEYYRDVIFKSMEKGLRGKWGQLSCGVVLECLTPWYLPTALQLSFSGNTAAAMRYDFAYDDELVYGLDSGGSYSTRIQPRGHVPGTVKVSYAGQTVNMTIKLVGVVSGTEYGRCSLDTDTGENDVLELNTQPRNSYIRNGDIDLIEHVDITHDPFFRVPIDEMCDLSCEADNELNGTVTAEVNYYFRTV